MRKDILICTLFEVNIIQTIQNIVPRIFMKKKNECVVFQKRLW